MKRTIVGGRSSSTHSATWNNNPPPPMGGGFRLAAGYPFLRISKGDKYRSLEWSLVNWTSMEKMRWIRRQLLGLRRMMPTWHKWPSSPHAYRWGHYIYQDVKTCLHIPDISFANCLHIPTHHWLIRVGWGSFAILAIRCKGLWVLHVSLNPQFWHPLTTPLVERYTTISCSLASSVSHRQHGTKEANLGPVIDLIAVSGRADTSVRHWTGASLLFGWSHSFVKADHACCLLVVEGN